MNNHDPASQLENFELLPGYEVNLFAANPMLANPVHMVWDSRGRLWVACSWAYPQLKPGEVADAFEVPLDFILDPGNHERQSRVFQGKRRYFYVLPYEDRYIWGATAGMLVSLYEVLTGETARWRCRPVRGL